MEQPSLSRESNVVLLLTSHIGAGSESQTKDSGLGPVGWHDFARNIEASSLDSPGSLLQLSASEWPDNVWTDEATKSWVENRLSRSTNLAMELEELNNRGIWVTTIFEPTYPEALSDTLGSKAPPFLYVAGDASNLSTPAIGFVGSRDADEQDKEWTGELVEAVINDGFGVVSGGAKGIDRTSEETGLECGGPVVEFPTEGIQRCIKKNNIRDAILEGTLTLASHYHPEAQWNIGSAMGRNKLIHGFAEYTIVIRSGESGGTWEGSTENLDNEWSPLLVCEYDETPPGNQALLKQGGIGVDPRSVSSATCFTEWLPEKLQDQTETSSMMNSTSSEQQPQPDKEQDDENYDSETEQSSLDQY